LIQVKGRRWQDASLISWSDVGSRRAITSSLEKEGSMYRKILIATDGSKSAGIAVDHGLKLAKATGAAVTIVYVTPMWSALDVAHAADAGVRNPIGDYETAAAESARLVLAAAGAKASKAKCAAKLRHIADKTPATGIVEAAASGRFDLIVMGTHGRRGVERLLLGSQAAEVLTLSKVPVLIVR
jgi:nucleotide-binding universal stress UspA family protein